MKWINELTCPRYISPELIILHSNNDTDFLAPLRIDRMFEEIYFSKHLEYNGWTKITKRV